MDGVVIVAEAGVMVVGVKAPVWAGAGVNVSVKVKALAIFVFADMLIDVFASVVITVLVDIDTDALNEVSVCMLHYVAIIVAAVVLSVSKFLVLVSCCGDVLLIIGVFVPGIGVDVLVGVSVNIFAVMVTALRGVMLAPVETFSC